MIVLANTYVDAEERGHTMQVVGVVGHSQHFRNNSVLSPLGTKLLHQLRQVAGGCLSDGIYCLTHTNTHDQLSSLKALTYTSRWCLKFHSHKYYSHLQNIYISKGKQNTSKCVTFLITNITS